MTEHATSPLLEGTLVGAQIDNELDMVRRGVQRYRDLAAKAIKRGDGSNLKPSERMLAHWFVVYSTLIHDEQKAVQAGKLGYERAKYGPLVLALDSDTIACIALHEIMSALVACPNGMRLTPLSAEVGRAVNAESNLRVLREQNNEHRRNLREQGAKVVDSAAWQRILKSDRQRLQAQKINRIAWSEDAGARWPLAARIQLGAFLVEMLSECATTTRWDDEVFTPAITIRTLFIGRKKYRWVEPTNELNELLAAGHAQRQHLRPRYEPMIVPPLPWTEFGKGGYYRLPTTLVIRGRQANYSDIDLTKCYDGLNALGATAWRINIPVMDVLDDHWENGGNGLGMPPRYPITLPDVVKTDDKEVIKRARQQRAKIYRLNAQQGSERSNFLHRMDVARRFKEVTEFYLPHNLDFRGRAYPIPIHLNHHKDDSCRALLRFAKTQRQTDEGRRWLMIHAANCYGIDKVSLHDRVHWVAAHASDMVASIRDPMGCEFWQQADKPWQFLAACYELDRSDGKTSLPVQVDGSCNGLQHYAAIGRDSAAAAAVNLIPADHPSDVYSMIADRVQRSMQAEAGRSELAAMLVDQGMITRKVVKRPVMTRVYGVTMVGARIQIAEELNIEDENTAYKASRLVEQHVRRAMGEVCQSAEAIMAWITRHAMECCNAGQKVNWYSPIGLWVIQPYAKASTSRVHTHRGTIHFNLPGVDTPLIRRRQVNAAAPNFIHSVDSSHLLMVAAECRRENIDIGTVHDSFWCPAPQVPQMRQIIAEQFVELHRRDLLMEFESHMRTQHERCDDLPMPKIGHWDVSDVESSDYAFC